MIKRRRDALVIFAKYPEPGAVKTRLGPQLSPEEASQFYRLMAEEIVRVHSKAGSYHCIVCCYPEEQIDRFRHWLGGSVYLIPQRGEDLGEKQLNAFIDSEKLGFNRTIIIGSDCPSITVSDIEEAFDQIESDWIALGPSNDGGYYLVGSTLPRAELFESVNWSTDSVFGEVASNAEKLGIDIATLPVKNDIDTYEDLVRCFQMEKHYVDGQNQGKMMEFLESLFGGKNHDE